MLVQATACMEGREWADTAMISCILVQRLRSHVQEVLMKTIYMLHVQEVLMKQDRLN